MFYAVAVAKGESCEPFSAGVLVFLLATVISVVALGCWGGWRWSSFPWLAAILTPLFLAAAFSLFGDRDLEGFLLADSHLLYFWSALWRAVA